MSHRKISALEFFSGIGAFSLVAKELDIEILKSYDQSSDANAVYLRNFGRQPSMRNLDSISSSEIPQSDFWWMSPPCKPFSRRGKQADLDDSRAKALINLLNLLPEKQPDFFALENVLGFASSRAENLLNQKLLSSGYAIKRIEICPSSLGIPMQRPRLFYLGSKRGSLSHSFERGEATKNRPLAEFIDTANDATTQLRLNHSLASRYFDSLNIIERSDAEAKAICFTSGYAQSMRTSGSFIRLPDGELRRFSPLEILKLLGFPAGFSFPPEMSLSCQFRLAGNSIEIKVLREVIKHLLRGNT
jgi:DNA (cytosine-5)-methyltransferase 1/tRNA (cytosine38-C5)-methyltransferase